MVGTVRRVYNARVVSSVFRRDIPAQFPGGCPSIVALPRVLNGPVEYDTASQPALEFPGCAPIRLTPDEFDGFEGRLELWDARTETAWIVRDSVSPAHEQPGSTLPALLGLIAAVRGSPIKCYGAMDLLQRDGDGRPRRIMEADQSVYLRPKRAILPGRDAMVVGEHDFPDVVLEVDHTTDVRRGKLLQYEAWGFPELWVEVPDWVAPSRPRALADSRTGRASSESERVLGGLGRGQNTSPVRATDFVALVPGLTIHALGEDGYETVRESRAFPGWTAAEIHLALNETTPSAHTCAVLERVGMVMGANEGTGPDDDPLLRSQRRKGYNIGRAQGRAEGQIEGRAAMAREILRSRGIEVPADFVVTLAELPAFAESSDAAIAAAAGTAETEADFLRRIQYG